MTLIGAMAVTAPGAWPHAPWFALLPVVAKANPALQEHPAIADALNVALSKLGVVSVRVAGVRTAADEDAGAERAFDISLVLEDGQIAHERVRA
jgi:hypothetical protein